MSEAQASAITTRTADMSVDTGDGGSGAHVEFSKEWSDVRCSPLEDGGHKMVFLGHKAANSLPFYVSLFGPLEIQGVINSSTLALSVSIDLAIPIYGKVRIGSGSGNLETGVTVNVPVSVDKIAKGTLTFTLRNRVQLYVNISLDTIIGNWHTDVHLFDV